MCPCLPLVGAVTWPSPVRLSTAAAHRQSSAVKDCLISHSLPPVRCETFCRNGSAALTKFTLMQTVSHLCSPRLQLPVRCGLGIVYFSAGPWPW